VGQSFYEDKRGLYGDPDEPEAFQIFSAGALGLGLSLGVDVFHLNDWHTTFVLPLALSSAIRVKSLFTIHNVGYQGQTDAGRLVYRLSPEVMDVMLHDGKLNFMKAGILLADIVNTVSQGHVEEIIRDMGFGMEPYLRKRYEEGRLIGILNGIDTELWNPETDDAIWVNYSVGDVAGKLRNTLMLRGDMELRSGDAPLIGMVSRLVYQKGLDVVADALEDIVGLGFDVVLLGTGDREIEERFEKLETRLRGRFAFVRAYDERLARRIYAGSTHFLMPSRYEPGGLAAMIAMRYGSVPVTRYTGGLKDFVPDCGYTFEPLDVGHIKQVLAEVVTEYKGGRWAERLRCCMEKDLSWDRSAKKYMEVLSKIAEEED
jgi:starch synthase